MTDPRGSVVLESPVGTEEVPALRFLVGTTDESGYQQKGDNSNDFGGE